MKKLLALLLLASIGITAQNSIEQDIIDIEDKLIEWRHDFHQNPELSNREFKTAEKIAKHLKSLGLEVETNVAKTGVVGILKGDKPGKVVAIRADIDALPVTERNDLPFKSEVKTTFLNTETGVMHACGHDTHISILMATAEVFSKHKDKISGTIKFIFQPAEEGPPPGEEGGAKLMIKEGVLDNPKVDAIFGLHINSQTPVGVIKYKTGGIMASVERFVVNVKGKQTHGSQPWSGVDPILISAKIIDGFQTIISREARLTDEAAVITVGKITSGTRFNIIPESAEMIGTVRTLDSDMRLQIMKRMNEMAADIAKAYGGSATIEWQNNTVVTNNDPELTMQILPSIQKVAGEENVQIMKATTGGEDFSYFQEKVPGVYFFLGGMTPGNTESFPHHTPDFKIDDSGMLLGVKAFTQITLDYLNN
ncbi:N-acyl-L-amino acid amidohydrolase [Winogradskyella sp. PC-19]|uniref:amidohydrolase n=1 Tax=unclassified Winogradskyella TaxID=2615021 RepID=UPI000B3CF80B|nr:MULTISPECIES: amidohydrolase [unclassified Winogradskyella]ARV08402.1 N-acyl-L-amino acid amidohydrolase [Winogradskyella sp. PC-19]RZN80973.1 MAG: amidohydrolase [Winogradskyella sp.]